jgi:hypothetical protein
VGVTVTRPPGSLAMGITPHGGGTSHPGKITNEYEGIKSSKNNKTEANWE